MKHQLCRTLAFFAVAALSGAAAAQADPVNLGNQATFVRFTDKVSFGAENRPQSRNDVEQALARLATFERRNEYKIVRSEITQRLHSIPQIARTRTAPAGGHFSISGPERDRSDK